MLLLTVLEGPDRGRRFELPADEPQLIGRSSEALPLSDTSVSRRHAELTPDGGRWWIRDLKSQNGTMVNGVPTNGRVLLREGDRVRVGSTLLLFGKEDADESAFVQLLRQSQLDSTIERVMPTVPAEVAPIPTRAQGHRTHRQGHASEHLRIIYALTHQTAASLDPKELLGKALDLVFAEFRAERGFVMLGGVVPEEPLRPVLIKLSEERSTPQPDGTPAADRGALHVSRTILQHTVRTRQAVLSTNAMRDPRFSAGDSVHKLGIRSAMCAPIVHGQRTHGAIYIDRSVAAEPFDPTQLALLTAIGQHVGLALESARLLNDKLQAERLAAVGQTVASLSHAIKNILQGLRGGADVLDLGLQRGDIATARGGWPILKRNLDRIVSLTLNMLAFSRQRAVELDLTQLAPIIEDCAQLLQPQCSSKGITLMLDLDQQMPPVPADRSMIHQALMNLLTNAVEALDVPTLQVRQISVQLRYFPHGSRGENAPAMAEISVADTGPGIPPDRQQRIFLPFQTTKGAKGTGLGLAVTKQIVQAHRGLITFESDGQSGARFLVLLPADPDAAIDPAATSTSQASPFGFGIDPPF